MFLRKAVGVLNRVARSPLTGNIIRATRVGLDTASSLGLPVAGALSKGLGVAERVLHSIAN